MAAREELLEQEVALQKSYDALRAAVGPLAPGEEAEDVPLALLETYEQLREVQLKIAALDV